MLVRTPQPAQLAKELERDAASASAPANGGGSSDDGPEGAVTVTTTDDGALIVRGMEAAEIGEKAAAARVVLHELTPQRASLEEAFMELTRGSVEYHVELDQHRSRSRFPARPRLRSQPRSRLRQHPRPHRR